MVRLSLTNCIPNLSPSPFLYYSKMSLPRNFSERIAELEELEAKKIIKLRERAAIARVERETAIEELFRVQQFILKKNQQLD